MPRKSITDMIPDIDEPAPAAAGDAQRGPEPQAPAGQRAAPPAPAPAPGARAGGGEQAGQRGKRRGARSAAAGPVPATAAKATRPTARDLAAPARASIAREALKADVPAELALLRRLHAYRIDKGVDIRDQVAIAIDEWLTAEGY
jgi:hypothetical protein